MDQKRKEQLLVQLGENCAELGWSIMIIIEPETQDVAGMVMGNDETINETIARFAQAGDKMMSANQMLEEKKSNSSDDGNNNGGPTFH